MQDFVVDIGLEVHVQLRTASKLFCNCSASFGAEPNSNICPVCAGYPGVLPIANKEAIRQGMRAALALNCRINDKSLFARKHYFYPDLPKNYQISQYEQPLAEHGYVEFRLEGDQEFKRVRLTRLHLEEDAGKLLHEIGARELDCSLVDLNRTGAPLAEIVSEPDIHSPEEAYQYLTTLKTILKYTGVSDCDMEKGSLRCDANISVRHAGQKELGTKTELKNMNSFKGVRDALLYESNRQISAVKAGERIVQETRLWDTKDRVTKIMRSKEEAHDYRYFPEPDLLPLTITESEINELTSSLPELPQARKRRFIKEYGLSEYDVNVLTSEKELADYYESCLKTVNAPKLIANWVTTELLGRLNAEGKSITDSPLKSATLAQLVQFIDTGKISGKIAKDVFAEMWQTGDSPEHIIESKGLIQITGEDELAAVVQKVLQDNPKAVKEYKEGKERAIGALVGAAMKETKGRANPQLLNDLLKKALSN